MTTFVLKIIASVCMLIDHIGAVFPSPWVFRQVLRLIGRIAFPIYAYLIAQGCKHTKDIYKYLLRLGIFALISEIPFDIAFMHYKRDGVLTPDINFLDDTNVFYTLFLGVASIIIYERVKTMRQPWVILLPLFVVPAALVPAFLVPNIDSMLLMHIAIAVYLAAALWLCRTLPELDADTDIKFPRKLLALVSAIPILCLGNIMDVDYGMMGVIYILFFYLMKPEDRLVRTIAAFSLVFIKYAYPLIYHRMDLLGIDLLMLPGGVSGSDNLYDFLFALVAVILICLYSGKQGRKAKWFFYIFYPAHIAVLAAMWFMFIRV